MVPLVWRPKRALFQAALVGWPRRRGAALRGGGEERTAGPAGRARERLNLRYAVVVAAGGALLWLVFRDELMGAVLQPLRTLIAQATLGLIHGVGLQATREASAIYHPGGFAYEISRGCTGFVPAVMLGLSIAAYPAERRHKVVGLALGIPALLGINLVRLVHLFYLGVHQPEWFHAAHTVAWEWVIILAVAGIWLGWASWVDRGVRTPA